MRPSEIAGVAMITSFIVVLRDRIQRRRRADDVNVAILAGQVKLPVSGHR